MLRLNKASENSWCVFKVILVVNYGDIDFVVGVSASEEITIRPKASEGCTDNYNSSRLPPLMVLLVVLSIGIIVTPCNACIRRDHIRKGDSVLESNEDYINSVEYQPKDPDGSIDGGREERATRRDRHRGVPVLLLAL